MRWVLITPLGMPVEPEVSRILAVASGPIAASASATAAPALSVPPRRDRGAGGRGAGGAIRIGLIGEQRDAGERTRLIERRERLGEGRHCRHVDQRRPHRREDVLELVEGLRHQRIGGRDRQKRDAGLQRAELQQSHGKRIVAQGRDRPRRAVAMAQQGCRHRVRTRACLGIGEGAPGVARFRSRGALGKEDARRRLGSPAAQMVGQGRRVVRRCQRRAQQLRAVGARFDHDLRRRQPASREGCGHARAPCAQRSSAADCADHAISRMCLLRV